jgi:hypothetical protein
LAKLILFMDPGAMHDFVEDFTVVLVLEAADLSSRTEVASCPAWFQDV